MARLGGEVGRRNGSDVGRIYGRLLVLDERMKVRPTYKKVECLCLCKCGKEKWITSNDLRTGRTSSCGCYHKERTAEASTKHGHAVLGQEHRLYKTWVEMRKRVNTPTCKNYPYYGGRGIKVCKRWDRFDLFLEDMLPTYREGLSLDRIDNNKDYCLENCRWATAQEQSENQRRIREVVDSNGVVYKNTSEAGRILGVRGFSIYLSIYEGRPLKDREGLRFFWKNGDGPTSGRFCV